MSMQGKKVVVTGGRGFLGGFVCKALKARGASVIPIGSSDYNLIEQQDVRRMYEDNHPDIVVHLAAACGGITRVEFGKSFARNFNMGTYSSRQST